MSHPGSIETCAACRQPFVAPVALLELVDEGLYRLALHCQNCDRLSVAVHSDAEVEAYEGRFHATVEDLEAYAEALELARFVDEVDGFSRALHANAVLPEDFGTSSR